MKVGIIGAGRIGGNAARRFAQGGNQVLLSFSRDPRTLDALAKSIGGGASVGSPVEAAACDVVMMSVPWGVLDHAIEQAGSLVGRIVIDTTNHFSRLGDGDLGGKTQARINADRMPGARYTKSFNTLTAAFQASSAGRKGDDRAVQWVCGDDEVAKKTVMGLIEDAGYAPIDLGGIDDCWVMEAPRRPGAVYGEEYRPTDARAVVDALASGHDIPHTPSYRDS